jgi:lysophospholipase L1-like esterase
MQVNKLFSSAILFAIVIISLLLLSYLPPLSMGDFQLKQIDLLKEIRQDRVSDSVLNDSLIADDSLKVAGEKKVAEVVKIKKDTCNGRICIEDFSTKKNVLTPFFNALRRTKHKPVRIAFFGDSFIEGDVICGTFRDTLQQLYGGRGVGYMPITSDVAGFRYTIKHEFENWEAFSWVSENQTTRPVCTSGYTFVPLEHNSVEYRPSKRRFLNEFNIIRLFYNNPLAASVEYTFNDTLSYFEPLVQSDGLEVLSLENKKTQSVRFHFPDYDSLTVFGVSFEDSKGIYVDNFSMRGNSGLGISKVDSAMHMQFNKEQDYKLIILQYGLNVVTQEDSSGYKWYERRMVSVIRHLKQYYPRCGILLVSVSDRSNNQDGTFSTIPDIPKMRDVQRRVAQKCGIAFWDLYEAMGGYNSIVKMAEAEPPLAAKDYTHLNFAGGKRISKHLVESLLYAKERYEKKK